MSAVTFSGPSAVALPTVELQVPLSLKSEADADESSSSGTQQQQQQLQESTVSWPSAKHQAILDFELDYVALKRGFASVGGLRLLLVGERFVGDGDEDDMIARLVEVRTLKEWNVVSEVWVL